MAKGLIRRILKDPCNPLWSPFKGWQCRSCTCMNHELVSHCEMCGGLKSLPQPQADDDLATAATATPAPQSDDEGDEPEESSQAEGQLHLQGVFRAALSEAVPQGGLEIGAPAITPAAARLDQSPLCCMPATPLFPKRVVSL